LILKESQLIFSFSKQFMSQNIFGYQGVNTPLESLTNGRYNVADYTTLRETVDARLSVLEKEQAQPTNVTVLGSLTVTPSSTLPGSITATGTISSSTGISTPGTIAGSFISSTFGGVQFPDLSVQTSALVPITPGSYTNTSITVNGAGVISSVASGSNGNTFVNVLNYNQSNGQTITVPASAFKQTVILLDNPYPCIVQLLNLTCENATNFPDGVRYVTVAKSAGTGGLISVDVYGPGIGTATPYLVYSNGGYGNYMIMSGGVYVANYIITKYGATRKCILISSQN
jgi:hypothetical protein